MTNAVNWFEIPVKNYERAKAFYATVLGNELQDMPMENTKYGVLPFDQEKGVGGAIYETEGAIPSENGTIIYLNGGEDLSVHIDRVEAAGGSIVFPKTEIGENGFIAHIKDTEGNRIGFHSMN